MTRFEHAARLGLACLALFTAVCSAGRADAAPESRTGTFHITLTIYFTANVPAGTVLTASANVNAGDYTSPSGSMSQTENCKVTIARSGNVGNATVDCPYRFTFESASYPKIKVFVGIGVYGGPSSTGQTVVRAAQANGATTPVAFALSM